MSTGGGRLRLLGFQMRGHAADGAEDPFYLCMTFHTYPGGGHNQAGSGTHPRIGLPSRPYLHIQLTEPEFCRDTSGNSWNHQGVSGKLLSGTCTEPHKCTSHTPKFIILFDKQNPNPDPGLRGWLLSNAGPVPPGAQPCVTHTTKSERGIEVYGTRDW